MESENVKKNFVEEIIDGHNASGRYEQKVLTRFPPEPNGYLHIGHAKAICMNFQIAQKYGGLTNLRFDDTNPSTEETEYVKAIKDDVSWLGFEWEGEPKYTSDYFGILFEHAQTLIKKGLAYVDDSSADEMAKMKGTPTKPGINSPFRERSIEENLDLFEGMKKGAFKEGTKVLRAKIDMSHSNMHMRDPIMYRIKIEAHHRTGTEWNIYPMYDFAHGVSDSIEGITHSLCTLEFEIHRPLYEWFNTNIGIFEPQQIEFARLNLTYTIMSKRKLLQLVNENHVNGWDDPRMPTLSGFRRKGYTPDAIRTFCDKIGIAKRENLIDVGLLEFCVKDDLNKKAARVMVVLNPLKVVITNYPEGETEWLEVINNPEDESMGSRKVPFSREIYVEKEDYMADAPKKFFRLSEGRMVRLKGAYIIRCDEAIKDERGEVVELRCTYFSDSKSGEDTSGLKAKGTLHFVSIAQAIEAEARVYDRLFNVENPSADKEKDFKSFINPESLIVLPKIYCEPALTDAQVGETFQFMRKGYYCVDKDSTADKKVFNLTVAMRNKWDKKKKK